MKAGAKKFFVLQSVELLMVHCALPWDGEKQKPEASPSKNYSQALLSKTPKY